MWRCWWKPERLLPRRLLRLRGESCSLPGTPGKWPAPQSSAGAICLCWLSQQRLRFCRLEERERRPSVLQLTAAQELLHIHSSLLLAGAWVCAGALGVPLRSEPRTLSPSSPITAREEWSKETEPASEPTSQSFSVEALALITRQCLHKPHLLHFFMPFSFAGRICPLPQRLITRVDHPEPRACK